MTSSSEVSRRTDLFHGPQVTHTGRSSAAIPGVEIRPETETQQEPEIDNLAEIQVSMSTIYEEGLGATRSHIPETAIQYVTADKLETTAAFPASQEIIVVESSTNLTRTQILLLTQAYGRHKTFN